MKTTHYYRLLFGSTVFYLLLPNLLFFATWFNVYLAILLVGLGLGVLISIFKNRFDAAVGLFVPSWQQHLLVLFSALFICLFSGIGGFHFQGDYEKHYAMLYDLVYTKWPVIYNYINGLDGAQHLNYYFAYFLPPAALAKITHPTQVDNWIIVWTTAGLYLAFIWFISLAKTRHVWWALCFLLFLGGQDFLYAFLKMNVGVFYGDSETAQQIFKQEIATVCVFHNTILRYPTNFFAISWAPQHIVGAWLATALLYFVYQYKTGSRYAFFLLGLMPLWSVFNVVGLCPVVVAVILKYKKVKMWISWQNAVGILFSAVVMVFFLAHHSITENGFLWHFIAWKKLLYKWPLFLLFEVGYVAILIYYFEKCLYNDKLFCVILIFLSFMPVYVLGNMNDLLIRAVIPSLFLLNLIAFHVFQKIRSRFKYLIVTLVFLGVILPQALAIYQELPVAFKNKWEHGFIATRVRVNSMPSLSKMADEAWFNTQYFGDNDSFYYKYLAPK